MQKHSPILKYHKIPVYLTFQICFPNGSIIHYFQIMDMHTTHNTAIFRLMLQQRVLYLNKNQV